MTLNPGTRHNKIFCKKKQACYHIEPDDLKTLKS